MEILVTLSVLALLMAIAAPSFGGLLRANRTSAAMKRFSLDLEFARSEARRLGGAVSLCISEGTSCMDEREQDWARGWIVFADTNANGNLDPDETLLRVQGGMFRGDSFKASDGRSSLTMGRTGMALNLTGSTTFKLNTSPVDAGARRCAVISAAGRESVFRGGTSACQ